MIDELTETFLRMREGCRPDAFYERVRPYLASLESVRYPTPKGSEVRSYHGGSAAQSSLLQSMDALLGIDHARSPAHTFLQEMIHYMPPAHGDFVRHLQEHVSLEKFIERHPSLASGQGRCVEALHRFRTEHLKIVAEYIVAQSRLAGPGQTGTGGTDPMEFLRQVRSQTK